MDSGNSGSFQLSSGDEEYDSRPADSISAIMSNNNSKRRAIPGIQSNPLSKPSQISAANFDPLSNYIDIISRPPPPGVHPPNPLLNLDMSWSKSLRSDPNPTADHHHHHLNPEMISSSSNIPTFFGSFAATTTGTSPTISMNPAEAKNNNASTSASATNTPTPASDQSNPAHVVRNPKKRSRASRRAPTTVLTTDTTNFRAMVQEFTGIPAPPFTSSSPFCRGAPRLDLYGTSPSSLRSNTLDSSQQPSYLRRPFPQKVQLPPPAPPPSLPFLSSTPSSSSSSPLLNSTSMVDLDHANNITSALTATVAAAAGLNFQLPTQTSATNLFNNLPNHLILSSALFQSKFPPANPPPNIGLEMPSKESRLKVGGLLLDQFAHVNTSSLGGLPGLIASGQTASRSNDNIPVNWDGNGNNLNLSSRMNAATNGKMNFSSSTNPSSFHGDKGTDNVAVAASRGEGMMESWICSSD